KTLVASAYAAHLARRSADYSVAIGSTLRIDMKRVKARKDAIVQRASNNVEKWLKGTPNLTVIEGHASFESARTVRVNGGIVDAHLVFVHTRGRALATAHTR